VKRKTKKENFAVLIYQVLSNIQITISE